MKKQVLLTDAAAKDLEDLLDFIESQQTPESADRVLDRVARVPATLGEFPEKGKVPRELSALGSTEYREVVSPPYRVIYRATDTVVYVYLIADARRDFQTLLARRLLEP